MVDMSALHQRSCFLDFLDTVREVMVPVTLV